MSRRISVNTEFFFSPPPLESRASALFLFNKIRGSGAEREAERGRVIDVLVL